MKAPVARRTVFFEAWLPGLGTSFADFPSLLAHAPEGQPLKCEQQGILLLSSLIMILGYRIKVRTGVHAAQKGGRLGL